MPGANLPLPITIDRDAPVGLSRQLQHALRDLIARGGLPEGTVLPPTRRLAPSLGVSRNVVLDAYSQLRHEGLLTARTGAGTRVAGSAREPAAAGGPRRGRRIDLHPDVTDLAGFPRLAWGRAVDAALRELPDRELGYGSPRGIHELRVQLAAYLARTRGIVADAESIVICDGLMSAVGLIREALDLRRVAVPRIGYPALAGALQRPGPPTGWLDVDGQGTVFERLPRGSGCAAVVQPAHHYPLGVAISEERAELLLAWARRGGLIVENDANADVFHAGPGPVALQGSAPECTVLIGSVSRTLAPGLRMGWLVAPPDLALRIGRHRARTVPGPPVIDQMAFARFLADGALDRQVRRLRGTCRSRSRALTAALRRELPDAEVTAPASGLHVTVALEPGTDEERVKAEAAAAGTRLFGLAEHVLHGEPLPPGLVVGFGALPEPSAAAAARAVRRAVAEARSS